MSNERDTVVVSGSNGSSAGWFIAGIIVVALAIVGYLAYNGTFSGDSNTTIELKMPEVPAPSAPAAPAAPAS